MAVLLAPAPRARAAAAQGTETPGTRFIVLLQGRPVGSETMSIRKTTDGWHVSATGSLDAPINLSTTLFELSYGLDWQPQSLTISALLAGQPLTLTTTFTPTQATTQGTQRGAPIAVSQPVSPRTVVLPNNFYAAYEALAARIGTAAVGAEFPIYVVPQAEITATVTGIASHRFSTDAGQIALRQVAMTFNNPGRPLAVDVWIDAESRLARVVIPAASLSVVREDLASVTTREETITRPGDEEVSIPSVGFNLAGTVSRPKDVTGPAPAVVLIAGSGPQDRDENVVGIPIFGEIAGALADRGFLVVRYDKRGVGRSGGRTESATIEDYAEDARRVVDWVRKRPDVDKKRVALVGHSEGGAVALIVAAHDDDVAAVALLAAPGETGREITLAQQAHALSMTGLDAASRQAKIDLEKRILDAVASGKGWTDLPADVRQQAETAWFKSWIAFDPAPLVAKVKQPVLIIQGALDTQVPPENADRLEAMAKARKHASADDTRKVIVPGINHLLVPAKSGEVDEYASLAREAVSPAVTSALGDWLAQTLNTPKK